MAQVIARQLESQKLNRDQYLDFLRALAITMVLAYHAIQRLPSSTMQTKQYTQFGAWGVDLFFVLSGWLIGGIFWREMQKKGSVALPIFLTRRWLRTIPPYAGALALAWGAVALTRNEPFDFGYLLFFQNYYQNIPFFLVSWSLCVEEHFYFFIPLLFVLLSRYSRSAISLALLTLTALPTVSRFLEYDPTATAFGYFVTASHLRADGLLLGFGASYVFWYGRWKINKSSRIFFAMSAVTAIALAISKLPPQLEYVFEPLIVAVGFMALLLFGVGNPATANAAPPLVRWLAHTSYSIYLTHALVIHICLRLLWDSLGAYPLVFLSIEIGIVCLVGWIFYRFIEFPSMQLRSWLAPVRPSSVAV